MNDWPVGSFPIQSEGFYPSESGLLARRGIIRLSVSKRWAGDGALIIVERMDGAHWRYAGTISRGQRENSIVVSESGFYRVKVSKFKRSFSMSLENR